jgi:hydroxypyruvate reductase
MRADALNLFHASVDSVNPYNAVSRFLSLDSDKLYIGYKNEQRVELDLSRFRDIYIVGGGKATAPMARAIEDLFGDRITTGVINVKYGFTDRLVLTEMIEADHPLPDRNGVDGTKKILDILNKAGEKDLIFSLISGGGSALLPHPTGDITLLEKQELTKSLLECGASIDEINTIRKHISDSKGGQMARAAYPATTVNLMLSDVVGDSMDVIASGPFVPDPSTFEDCAGIINKYELDAVPVSIAKHLKKGADREIPDTPKKGENIFENVHNIIIGSNIIALEAARVEAEKLDYNTLILSSMIEGETRDVAHIHTAILREVLKTGRPVQPPACIISGGETTVTIKGDGLGGRNLEFCLAAALDIKDLTPPLVILSGGTDGNDGPTDAAGAIVDPLTIQRGLDAGLNAIEFLANNDSYHFFEKTNDLVKTGPTNTNVMDVRFILVRKL